MSARKLFLVLSLIAFPLLATEPAPRAVQLPMAATPIAIVAVEGQPRALLSAGGASIVGGSETIALPRLNSPVAAVASGGGMVIGTLSSETFATFELTSVAAAGDVRWSRHYSLAGDGAALTSLAALPAGGVVAGGSEGLVAQIAADGTVAWSRRFEADAAAGAAPARGGGIFVAFCGGILAKLNGQGAVVWARKGDFCVDHFIALAGGGFAAMLHTGLSIARPVIANFDDDGTLRWAREVSAADGSLGLAETTGGDLVAAVSGRFTGDQRMQMVFAVSPRGELRWAKAIDAVDPAVSGSFPPSLVAVAGDNVVVLGMQDPARPAVVRVFPVLQDNACLTKTTLVLRDRPVRHAPAELRSQAVELQSRAQRESIRRIEVHDVAACPAPPAAAVAAAPFDARFVAHEEELRTLRETAIAALEERRFADLDAMADRYRGDRSWITPLGVRAAWFYAALTRPCCQDDVAEWLAARPQSVAARILQPAAACSNGDAPPAGWEERLAGVADPHAVVAKIWCLDPNEIEAFIEKTKPPASYPLGYILAAQRLLEDREAFRRFAARAADLTRGELGDSLYARFVTMVMGAGNGSPFSDYQLDWPRAERGYRDLIARMPEWLPTYHLYARAAVMAKARATARELFTRPQLAWTTSPSVHEAWKIETGQLYNDALLRQTYDAARTWAMTNPAPPAAVAAASRSRTADALIVRKDGKLFGVSLVPARDPKSLPQATAFPLREGDAATALTPAAQQLRARVTIRTARDSVEGEILTDMVSEFLVVPASPVTDDALLVGAAVFDENGYVVGIVRGRRNNGPGFDGFACAAIEPLLALVAR